VIVALERLLRAAAVDELLALVGRDPPPVEQRDIRGEGELGSEAGASVPS
jgi:hypothetical protein